MPRSAISYAGIDDGNGAAASADFPATCMFRCVMDGYARSVVDTGASGDNCSAMLGLWCGDGEECPTGGENGAIVKQGRAEQSNFNGVSTECLEGG